MSRSSSNDVELEAFATVCTARTSEGAVEQPCFQCLTCDRTGRLVLCLACSIRCHRGHDTRATTVRSDQCRCTHDDTSSSSSPSTLPLPSSTSQTSASSSPSAQSPPSLVVSVASRLFSHHARDRSCPSSSSSSSTAISQSQSSSDTVRQLPPAPPKAERASSSSSSSSTSTSSLGRLFTSIRVAGERPGYRAQYSDQSSASHTRPNTGNPLYLCTYALYGPRFLSQSLYECLDCDLSERRCICEPCVLRCHAGHRIRASSLQKPAFCDCGEMHCKNLQAPRRAQSRSLHRCSAFQPALPTTAPRLGALCSVRRTGPHRRTQLLYVCLTCDPSRTSPVCPNCAALCHATHSVRSLGVIPDSCCQCGTSCVAASIDNDSTMRSLTAAQLASLRSANSAGSGVSASASPNAALDLPEAPTRGISASSSNPSPVPSSPEAMDRTDTGGTNTSDPGVEGEEKQLSPIVMLTPLNAEDASESFTAQSQPHGDSHSHSPPWLEVTKPSHGDRDREDGQAPTSEPPPTAGPIVILTPAFVPPVALERTISAPAFDDDDSPLDFSPPTPQRIQTAPVRQSAVAGGPLPSLAAVLAELGLSSYLTSFNHHDLDLQSLFQLDERAWHALVPIIGHRVRIQARLRELFHTNPLLGVYQTVLANMVSSQRITERDLTILHNLRAQHNITFLQHTRLLQSLGCDHNQWERITAVAAVSEADSGSASNSNVCVICLERLPCFAVVPCFHVCFCSDCARQFRPGQDCPKCRCQATSIQRIWV